MIIDCHGHYTTAPAELEAWRKRQIAAIGDPAKAPKRSELVVSDDAIRQSLENAQLRMQRERGTDVTIFSPRASFMAHHIGDESVSREWSALCNDLVHRVCQLFPDNFIGVCQLPQSPGVRPESCIAELERAAWAVVRRLPNLRACRCRRSRDGVVRWRCCVGGGRTGGERRGPARLRGSPQGRRRENAVRAPAAVDSRERCRLGCAGPRRGRAAVTA